ncbi:hypothetical protein CBS63078_4458 [Aspergillus niger]|uniref:Uncharacterized protein n=3 Tax=Aspergillus TaxID=5052 RepID=A0A370Q169_ASPPH|nr:hypothetical protein ASPNIDRAFT_38538 [Aspergillus niger ATCC 1015]KAI2909343.1 hypothetical protein CBS63078_4458 [Aspergillus niger]RDK48188.1 hypothetical protein M752DRAFT_272375 [Aspergillus phoenicis ATCC 13157]KAI2970077.1 hypothetical protein CBS147323_3687 [Aspergillus niger]KAI2995294.1 hypothetical protein CBS147482_8255 [Aspergillus niger]
MGNICSKSKNQPDAFSSPGRVLGSALNNTAKDSSAPRAPLPSNAKPASNWGSGPSGRTLGSGNTAAAAAGDGNATADARTNAALAAQKRAESASATGSKGKLGTKLAAQKAQTQNQTLNEASRDEVAAREADGAAEARRWQ